MSKIGPMSLVCVVALSESPLVVVCGVPSWVDIVPLLLLLTLNRFITCCFCEKTRSRTLRGS